MNTPLPHRPLRELLDAFDLSNIKVMVNLLQNQVENEVIHDVVELLHRMNVQYTQVLQNMRILEDTVNIDVKTGLLRYQDTYFENILKNLSRILISSGASAQIEAYHLSYVRLDVDSFSRFNSLYGHLIGDQALRQLGLTIKDTIRPTDLAIRYGGEEIDIILPATTAEGAKVFLDKLFTRIRSIQIAVGSKQFEKLTVSGGLTTIVLGSQRLINLKTDESRNILLEIQQKIDNALYESKATGKDRYLVYEEGRESEYEHFRKTYPSQKGK